MADDWELLGYDNRIIKISMKKVLEPRVLDTRMSGGKGGVREPFALKGVHYLQSEVDRRFTRSPGHGHRLHAEAGDEWSIRWWRINLIVEGSILLLARGVPY
jgi:hypothetical protein